MKSTLTPTKRASIQIALAEAFIDSTVDYASIAERIQDYDLKIVEDILYTEVAPVCFSNLETPTPPIWMGFKDEWLLNEISKKMKARNASWIRKKFDALQVVWLRYSYGYIWQEIMSNCKR